MNRFALRVWGRLPRPLRRELIRLGTPSHTVGAIGIVEHDGSLLLVRLAYRRDWGFPGGLLARGEQPAATVVREVAEEVGLSIDLRLPPVAVVDPRTRRVDVVFRCAPAAGVDPAAASPRSAEIVETRWWPADELPRLHPEAAEALRVSRSLR